MTCLKCGRKARYLPTKEFEGDFPYRFVADWYDAQEAYINQLDVTGQTEARYTERVRLSEVIPYKKKVLLDKTATVELYGHSIVLKWKGGERVFTFDETPAVTVLGRNKLNIYYEDTILQLKGDKRFNAVKYVHLFHRYKNLKRGNDNEQFLGL